MTKNEAIQILQTALTSPFIYGEYADAIDIAINALKEQTEWKYVEKDEITTYITELFNAIRESEVEE